MLHSDENRQNTYNTVLSGIQPPQRLAGPTPTETICCPAFQFSVLTCHANLLLAKTVFADGTDKPYDDTKTYLFEYHEIKGLDKLANFLRWLAPLPHKAIIRGQLLPGLYGWQYRRKNDRPDGAATLVCPARSWLCLDLDGVEVLYGLGNPDELEAAAYLIRDNMLPKSFEGVQCVASVTASTGRKGPLIARLRLFFAIPRLVENKVLRLWVKRLADDYPGLHIDPGPMDDIQIIYTARPQFNGCTDPVPADKRVVVLGSDREFVEADFDKVKLPKPRKNRPTVYGYNGEASAKAWRAIKQIYDNLKGCPHNGGEGRHITMSNSAWRLARLCAEGELSEDMAREVFLDAAKDIWNRDNRYPWHNIEQRIDDALNAVFGRRG